MKFKVGDKVFIFSLRSTVAIENNLRIGVITSFESNNYHRAYLGGSVHVDVGDKNIHVWLDEIKLIATEKQNNSVGKKMNILSNIAKKLFDADTQVLVKAGYLESNLQLSYKGKEALEALNLEANKVALVTLAQADLDEEAKKCK